MNNANKIIPCSLSCSTNRVIFLDMELSVLNELKSQNSIRHVSESPSCTLSWIFDGF